MKVSIDFIPRLLCTLICEDCVHMFDVLENRDTIEVALYRRDCELRSLVFVLSKAEMERENKTLDDIAEMVAFHIADGSCLADYDAHVKGATS